MRKLIPYGIFSVLLGSLCVATSADAQTIAQARGTGNTLNYPSGTRIYQGGTIISPRGRTSYPASTIRGGDGSTTFYYRNGTSITTKGNAIAPSGTYLTPGVNGNLRNNNLNNRR